MTTSNASITIAELDKLIKDIETSINDAISDVLYGDEVEHADVHASGMEDALNIVRHIVSTAKREAFERQLLTGVGEVEMFKVGKSLLYPERDKQEESPIQAGVPTPYPFSNIK